MPTRKTTAKKTVARKSASSSKPAKTTAAKKPAAPAKGGAATTHEELGERIAAQIEAGTFDASIIRLEEAITERLNVFMQEQAKKEAAEKKSASGEKKLPEPPKKSPTKKTITPKPGEVYRVTEKLSRIGGALVKYKSPKPGVDHKVRVEMVSNDFPGVPQGKGFSIPLSALEEAPKSKKPVRKKK